MTATQPTDAQLAAFAARDQEGEPVVMVNLLKFKEKAEYAEGTPEHGEDVPGMVAYARYGVEVNKILLSIGAEPLFTGAAPIHMIGEGDWDMAALVRYPSRKTFLEMTTSEAYQAIHYHREAGLAHQELIETLPLGG